MSGRTYNVGLDSRPEVPLPEYAETEEQAQDLLHLCLRKLREDPGDFIGWDTETHGKKMPFKIGTRNPLDWMSDTVTFWSLALRYRGEYRRFCIPGVYFQGFAPLLENPAAWFACWNAKYDAHVAWNCMVDVWNANIVDGLALAHMHDENLLQHGLKYCAHRWVGLPMTSFASLFPQKLDAKGKKVKEFETSLYDLPIERVIDYASYDAFCHLITVEWVRDRLKDTPIHEGYSLWDYFLNMEMEVTKVLWRMERRGMCVDESFMRSKIPDIDKEITEIERSINQQAGRVINLASNPQLAGFFFNPEKQGGLGLEPVKLTKGGKPSVDKDVMALLNDSGVEVAKKIVRHRKISKIKSTYLTNLLDLAEYYGDGKIHPNFNQFGARTGRCSTDAPNSQNFPRAGGDEFGIRRAFVAPPGYKLIVADYEQLEMRIMAHMSGDKRMIKAILDGMDLHAFTVSRMVPGVTYDEVVAAKKAENPTDRQKWLLGLRQDSKAIGFGIIYGAGPPRIAAAIDISDEDVNARIEKLLKEEARLDAAAAANGSLWQDSRWKRKKGQALTGRIQRMMKRNPILTQEEATIQAARQSIASEKIQAYFDTFPDVKTFMDNTPEACRYTMFWNERGEPRFPPSKKGDPVTESGEYDWDTEEWIPESRPMTRTGHEKPFGYVQTLCGRYRRLEDINHKNYRFKSEAERMAINTPIQGSAADIVKGAMLRIENCQELNFLGLEVLNQVHDELIAQVPEGNAQTAWPIMEECMVHPFKKGEDPLVVPIPVEGKIANCWAEGK
jgi:DNA polymerase I-like protein with 3'-5' exonuclease and polymerase domains